MHVKGLYNDKCHELIPHATMNKELGGHILIFVEGVQSKSCRLIGCAEVLEGHSKLYTWCIYIKAH